MKNIKHICAAVGMMISFSACSDWLDINKNSDAPTSVPPEQILPVLTFYSSQINYDHAEYGVYLSQALTTGGKSQTGSYGYKSGWEFLTMNRHPQWRRHFYDIGVNVQELIKAAEKFDSPNFTLIGRTMRLMSTHLTTDAFGDMPLSKAYTGVSPAYDTQESIYEWMLQEADALIAAYDDPAITTYPGNKKITETMDRIYKGDLSKWKKFTIALKARILLRNLPNWNNNVANCDAIINTVNQALDGWEEPRYYYPGGTGEANCPWGKSQPMIGGWESRANLLDKAIPSEFLYKNILGGKETLDSRKGNADDPRVDRLMSPRVGPDNINKYRYLKNNIGMSVSYKESHYPDLYTSLYTQNDSYIPLMLTEELLFMKAEALYWKGLKADAYTVTKEAVEMNFDRLAPDPSSASAKLYAAYVKMYFTTATIVEKYLPEDNFNIGHLLRQKYIAMMYQPEQWNDMRRYCYSNNTNNNTYDGAIIYPGLRRPYNLYEAYWINNGKEEWLQRINYDPETEEKYNVEELKRLGAYKNAEWLKKPMVWAIYNASHQ